MTPETKTTMSEQIRKEKAVLFSKPVPSKYRVSRNINQQQFEDVEAVYFAKRSKAFAKKYGHPIYLPEDLQKVFAFICNLNESTQKQVMSKSRKSKTVFARKMFAFFAYYYFGLIQQQAADFLRKERSTIATHITDFITELEIYAVVREEAAKVDKFIYSILEERKP